MKLIWISLKMLGLMTLLTGVMYPLLIWSYANIFLSEKANGSFIYDKAINQGSELIGQKFTKLNYFWTRPSAIDYNSLSSGASNLSQTSEDLVKKVNERKKEILQNQEGQVPQDMLFASASGLDPHISLESAEFQLPRVAKNRKMSLNSLTILVQQMTEKPQLGLFGEVRINVLRLNLALDKMMIKSE